MGGPFTKKQAAGLLVMLYFLSVLAGVIGQGNTSFLKDSTNQQEATNIGQSTTIAIGSWPDGANERIDFDVSNGSSIRNLDLTFNPSTIPSSTANIWTNSNHWKSNSVYDGMNVNSTELTLLPKGIMWDFESTAHGWTLGSAWSVGYDTTIGQVNGVHSGSNALYTYNGNYPNYMGQNYATSPTFDCSGCSGTWSLKYWKRLGIESASFDHAYVQVTNSGGSWSTIWSHTSGTTNPSSWSQMTHDISNYIGGNANFQVRFVMGTTDGSVTYTGWNVDDVQIEPTGGISGGEGNWTSQVISPLLDGRGELREFGLMHIDASLSSGSLFEWSLIDASTGAIIPGFENMDTLTTDLGVIDWNKHPEIRLKIHISTNGGSVAPIIRSISFNGHIAFTFDNDPTEVGWNLNGSSWSTSGTISGTGTTLSPEFKVRSGFSKFKTMNDIIGDGVLQFSIDSGETWLDLPEEGTYTLSVPAYMVQFRMTSIPAAQTSWTLNTFDVELVRTSTPDGLRIDVGLDGAPEWSMDQAHIGRLGMQDRLEDGSMWKEQQYTVSSSANFYVAAPKKGVDALSFFLSSPLQEMKSPYLALSVDGTDVMSRSLPNIQFLHEITLTPSERANLNTALSNAQNTHGIPGLEMTLIEFRIGSSLEPGSVTLGGFFAPYNGTISLSFDSTSSVVLGLNSELMNSPVVNGQRTVSLPIRMSQSGAVVVVLDDVQSSTSVLPVSLVVENASNTLTPSTSWIRTRSTFDLGLMTMDNPLTYAINSNWQVELNLNGLLQASSIRCSLGQLPVTAMSISSCSTQGQSLMWNDAGNMGEIVALTSGSRLEIQHKFKIPDGWNDEQSATLGVHLISGSGPMLPVTHQFGLGHSNGVENDIEVKSWSILSSNGVRSSQEYPYLQAGQEVSVEVRLGFEGVEERAFPRTGQALVRFFADGYEVSSTSILYEGVALLPYTVPIGRTQVELNVEVIPLKGQDVVFPMARNLTFGFDTVQPTLLYSNIDTYSQHQVGQDVELQFLIADRPHLPTHSKIHLWTSWKHDENDDMRMQFDETTTHELVQPLSLDALSGFYTYNVNIRQASVGDFFIGWLDVADSAGHVLQEGGNFQSPMFFVQINNDEAPSIGTTTMKWNHSSGDVWLHPEEMYELSIPLYERGGISDIQEIRLDLSSNAVQSSTIIYNSTSKECTSLNNYLEIESCDLTTVGSEDYFARDGMFSISFNLKWGYDPDVNLRRLPLITLYDQIGQSNQFELSALTWRFSGEITIDKESIEFKFADSSSSEIGYFVEPRTVFDISSDIVWYRTGERISESFEFELTLGNNDFVANTENSSLQTELLAPLEPGTFGLFAELHDAPSGALFRGVNEALVYIIVDETAPKVIAVNQPSPNRMLLESEWDEKKFEIRIREDTKINASSITLNWAIHEQGLGLNSQAMLEGLAPMNLIGGIDSGESIPFEAVLDLDSIMTVGMRSMSLELRIWISGNDEAGHNLERSFNDIDAPLRVWPLEQRIAAFEFSSVELTPSSGIQEGDVIDIVAFLKNTGQASGEAQLVMELVESNGARTRLASQSMTAQSNETILFQQEWIPNREGTMWIEIHILNSNNTFGTSETIRVQSASSDGLLSSLNEVNSTLLVIISLIIAGLVVVLIYGLKKPAQHQMSQLPQHAAKNLPTLEQPSQQQYGAYGGQTQAYSPGDNPYQ